MIEKGKILKLQSCMNTTYMLKSNLPVYSSVIVVMVVGAVDVVVEFPKGRSKKLAFFRSPPFAYVVVVVSLIVSGVLDVVVVLVPDGGICILKFDSLQI